MSEKSSETLLREQGSAFLPKFDDRGLLTAIAIDHASREILMVAFMNETALERTMQTMTAHFWSRSRKSLWMKGETSGHVLDVVGMRVDCDQDAIILECRAQGPACHTGETSCFYRKFDGNALVKVNA